MERSDLSWLDRPLDAWRIRRLDSAEAARSVAPRHLQLLLRPFHGGEATVSRAAREAGVSTKKMYYHVARWERAGVLEVTRVERRAGKPLKYYSTACDWLVVPIGLTDAVDTAEHLGTDLGAFVAALTGSFFSHAAFGSGAIHMLAGPDGRATSLVAPDDMAELERAGRPQDLLFWRQPSGLPGAFSFGEGRLEREDAERLAARFNELVAEARLLSRAAEGSPTAKPYRLFVGLASFDDN